MKTLTLIQGTPEWLAHRAQHFNASDAPVMLGLSPNKKRSDLLKEIATGIAVEFSDFVQERVIDPGHAFEANARALAEEIIGEELFPCVGVADSGRLSASYDGLTLLNDVVFEHKSMNEELREAMFDGCTGADLPKHYRVQMEQQLVVSGAERALFMASKWDADGNLIEERHCWYTPDSELRAMLTFAWEQFEADVAAYEHVEKTEPAPVGRAPDQLPALHIEVTGMVTASNLREFQASAMAVLGSINRDLQTDEDFANAEQTVKWCKAAEDRLDAAKAHALSQTASIDELFRTIDSVSAEARKIRLELDKLVTREKENRKAEIVRAAVSSVSAHIASINATLGEHALSVPSTMQAVIGAAIKGKRTIASIKDAADSAAAQQKIDASQYAERIRACIAVLAEHPAHASLFADRVALCATKQPEDLRNLVAARIAEHDQREAARLEQERERIRKEEQARIEREQAEKAAADSSHGIATAGGVPDSGEVPDRVRHMTGSGSHVQGAGTPAADGLTTAAVATVAASPPCQNFAPAARIKLGDINAAIAPLSITADGLATLGFKPVASRGAAKLYAASDFQGMCAALTRTVAGATARIAQLAEAA